MLCSPTHPGIITFSTLRITPTPLINQTPNYKESLAKLPRVMSVFLANVNQSPTHTFNKPWKVPVSIKVLRMHRYSLTHQITELQNKL
jgi:hypothetical protein